MNKIFSAVFGLLFFICASCHAYSGEGFLRVTMLDIGQGDSFLIETHEQNILIDTGDVSESKKLVAELKKAGVNRLEKVILTHPHADHIGGLQALTKNFVVLKIFDNGIESNSPLYRKYRNADIPVAKLKAGDLIALGDGVTFHVFFPNQKTIDAVNRGLKSDPNNESVVGRLSFGQFGMIFTGDIGKTVEENLLGKRLRSTALKAPHHGSRTSSSPEFVAAVRPQFIFISAGKDNRFGHPHKSTLAIYKQLVPPENIFCTASNGTVVLLTDGVKTSVTAQFN